VRTSWGPLPPLSLSLFLTCRWCPNRFQSAGRGGGRHNTPVNGRRAARRQSRQAARENRRRGRRRRNDNYNNSNSTTPREREKAGLPLLLSSVLTAGASRAGIFAVVCCFWDGVQKRSKVLQIFRVGITPKFRFSFFGSFRNPPEADFLELTIDESSFH